MFEQHIPERVRLPQHPIRVGSQVVSRDDEDSPTFEVILIDEGLATLVQVRDQDGAYLPRSEHANGDAGAFTYRLPRGDLRLRRASAPRLPAPRLGRARRRQAVPHRHQRRELPRARGAALHPRGKVDCIYIDPPYNTGARDWKYNNDYVDDDDAYRHSKWLAFMERRLLLAKELLNPDDSVLIVTIDEKEYLRLGLLLEQTFPEASIQMVDVSDQPSRDWPLGRVLAGRTSTSSSCCSATLVSASRWRPDRLLGRCPIEREPLRLPDIGLCDAATAEGRTRRQFYPDLRRRVTPAGSSRSASPSRTDVDRLTRPTVTDCVAVLPIAEDGTEMNWASERLRLRGRTRRSATYGVGDGTQLTKPQHVRQSRTCTTGPIADIEEGRARSSPGASADGCGDRCVLDGEANACPPTTVWTSSLARRRAARHACSWQLAPGPTRSHSPSRSTPSRTRSDSSSKDKPDAVVLDFFAGSGTTAHAVTRLNRQDGGRRQSIMVTNNEVSADEAKELREPGSPAGRPGVGGARASSSTSRDRG